MKLCMDCGKLFVDIKRHAKSELSKLNQRRRWFIDQPFPIVDLREIDCAAHLEKRVALLAKSMLGVDKLY